MKKLFYGDNLTILRNHIQDESIDLIYLDPPFNSKATYNVLFKTPNGHESDAQIEAFDDSWHWGGQAEQEFEELLHHANTRVAEMMRAFRQFLGVNDMMAYLVMMANRLLELHRVLKPTGSLYLHCDPTASHYLKLVLDGVFGPNRYCNEIIWKRTHAHGGAMRFGPVHDVIHFFCKGINAVWNPQQVAYSENYVKSFFRFSDSDGQRYRLTILTGSGVRHGSSGLPWKGYDPTSIGRHWAVPGYVRKLLPNPETETVQEALDQLEQIGRIVWSQKGVGTPSFKQYLIDMEGVDIQDIWTDIPPIGPQASERLGYPTQKPLALLERIIQSSSNENDIVLDPFCGCGTAVHAAEKLNRRWIGIDITHLAVSLIEKRMRDAFPGVKFEVHGTPKDLAGARDLAARDKYQFQWWACSLVNAQPYQGKKKGADSGIDGLLYFLDGSLSGELASPVHKKIVVSVKGGEHVHVSMIRDLAHVVDREKAEIGLFVTMVEPSRPMMAEAAATGYYSSPFFPDKKYPKIQILTIGGLLEGNEHPLYPDLSGGGVTFKKAALEHGQAKQRKLF